MTTATRTDPLAPFSEATRTWFREAFAEPTRAQELGWRAISGGSHTLIHAPTGSGKMTWSKALVREIPAEERLITIEERCCASGGSVSPLPR